MAMTAKSVAAARHPGGHKRPIRLPDASGLYLQVTPAGSRSWLFRFKLGGVERWQGLGSASSVSLAAARQLAAAARTTLAAGSDPIQARRDTEAAAVKAAARAAASSFKTAAEAYLAANASKWTNAKHAAQWTSTLVTYAYPVIGHLAVASITSDDVLRLLEPLWATKRETGSRVRSRIETILDYASVRGWREGMNPAAWRGNLARTLPPARQKRTVRHHPALPYGQVAAFIAALDTMGSSMGARALEFAILTAARSNEVLHATWREIDFTRKLWVVPASRMKARVEHRVPLSEQAIELLYRMQPLRVDDSSYLFPGQKRGKPLSVMALEMTVRRMNAPHVRWVDANGQHVTPHGFRSCFRDWAGETTDYPREIMEAALAHQIGGVEGAYARGDLLIKRKALMDDWAAYCYKAHIAEQIIPVKAA